MSLFSQVDDSVFHQAASNFVHSVSSSALSNLIASPSLSDASNCRPYHIVIKKNKKYFWNHVSLFPMPFTLSDILDDDGAERFDEVGSTEAVLVNFERSLRIKAGGKVEASLAMEIAGFELDANRRIVVSVDFGKIVEKSLDIPQLANSVIGRKVNLEKDFIKEVMSKKRQTLCLVVATLSPEADSKITTKVKTSGSADVKTGVKVPIEPAETIGLEASARSNRKRTLEIPSNTPLAFRMLEILVRPDRSIQLMHLPKSEGGFKNIKDDKKPKPDLLPNLEIDSASELDLQSTHDDIRITSSLVIKDEDDERMAEEEEEMEDTTTSVVKATNTVIVCLVRHPDEQMVVEDLEEENEDLVEMKEDSQAENKSMKEEEEGNELEKNDQPEDGLGKENKSEEEGHKTDEDELQEKEEKEIVVEPEEEEVEKDEEVKEVEEEEEEEEELGSRVSTEDGADYTGGDRPESVTSSCRVHDSVESGEVVEKEPEKEQEREQEEKKEEKEKELEKEQEKEQEEKKEDKDKEQEDKQEDEKELGSIVGEDGSDYSGGDHLETVASCRVHGSVESVDIMSDSSTSPIMFNVAYESDYESHTCSDDSDNGDDFEQTPDKSDVADDDDDGFEDKEDDDQFDIREWIAGVEAEEEDEVIEEGEWKMGLSAVRVARTYNDLVDEIEYVVEKENLTKDESFLRYAIRTSWMRKMGWDTSLVPEVDDE
ncbi:cilia- and flagella-associated protein 251-like [Strongylocentrotus purpuratus]|uniref:Gasdermin pore forming domain-containing protein n=1 Tax=Strongylocentrotus purpuratus TaxID=7668 RepID=A0A7M7N2T4_STRPU|nr:cilia- and flagella-associated protein 251-like [Strongylocentrotus purpuratus]